ncbi:MAG: class C sortase [Ruminococcus sp.]|nr:class C sortase [Ruminococcus sp.]
MKRKALTVVSLVLFVLGIALILYPSLSKEVNTAKTNSVIEDFDYAVELMNEESSSDATDNQTSNKKKDKKQNKKQQNMPVLDKELLDQLYKDLKAYNDDLIVNGQSSYGNAFVYQDAGVDLSAYGIYDGLIGYVSIPSIDTHLPIYLGANNYNMAKGAAHMNRTSMPIGGKSTNCAIAAHRGMINQTMFDNIVYMNEGDDLYIVNYWGKLHYRVRETRIINPSQTNSFLIEKGEDLVTLLTCHPYGSNAQRFLVICERVD